MHRIEELERRAAGSEQGRGNDRNPTVSRRSIARAAARRYLSGAAGRCPPRSRCSGSAAGRCSATSRTSGASRSSRRSSRNARSASTAQAFFTRLIEVTPNAGWVDFDEHGLPADSTHLSAATCRSLERMWRADEPLSFSCLRSALRTGDARARGGSPDARTRVVAPPRRHERGADAVLRDPDGRAHCAAARRAAAGRARRGELRRHARFAAAGGRLPLARMPSTRRLRPPSGDACLAQLSCPQTL